MTPNIFDPLTKKKKKTFLTHFLKQKWTFWLIWGEGCITHAPPGYRPAFGEGSQIYNGDPRTCAIFIPAWGSNSGCTKIVDAFCLHLFPRVWSLKTWIPKFEPLGWWHHYMGWYRSCEISFLYLWEGCITPTARTHGYVPSSDLCRAWVLRNQPSFTTFVLFFE